jgi:hypothetical protein
MVSMYMTAPTMYSCAIRKSLMHEPAYFHKSSSSSAIYPSFGPDAWTRCWEGSSEFEVRRLQQLTHVLEGFEKMYWGAHHLSSTWCPTMYIPYIGIATADVRESDLLIIHSFTK